MNAKIMSGTVVAMLLAFGGIAGCSNMHDKYPDVSSQIRNSLDQAGLKDVSVSQDRDTSLACNVSRIRRCREGAELFVLVHVLIGPGHQFAERKRTLRIVFGDADTERKLIAGFLRVYFIQVFRQA